MSEEQPTVFVEDETLRQGFTQIPNSILRMKDVSAGAKLTYVALLSYAWQKGSCFPGQETLAEDMGVSKRSVITYLQELQKAGLLRVTRRGLGRTNVYVLPKSRSAKSALPEAQTSRSENLALHEVKDPTLPEVQNLQREEYSTKNTQGEEDSTGRPDQSPERLLEERHEVIRRFVDDFGREFRDRVSVSRSTGRAYKLYQKSNLELEEFLRRMYEARQITKKHSPNGSKMAYFFACLEDRLGPREGQEDGSRDRTG